MDTKERGFLSLIEQHSGIIYKVANAYCKENENRKDLVQEILIQLWKAFDRYNDRFKVSTWMYRIALNVSISYYRRNNRRALSELPFTMELVEIAEELSTVALDAELNLLQHFIAELKELDRALMLLFLEEKSHKEMAEILGLTETNVATKISRIREKLKNRFLQVK